MASSSSFLASLLIFLSVFWGFKAICNASSQEGTSLGFSMKLTHRDSPRSPHYRPSATTKDRVRAMIDRSISRARYISSVVRGTSTTYSDDGDDDSVYSSIASSPSSAPTSAPSSMHSKVISNDGDYLMEVEIGTPPVKIMGVADTGSDLIWIQCKPCQQCYNQTDPIFDPSKSSTFDGSVSCSDRICVALPKPFCEKDHCSYAYAYGDGSGTFGMLARETFTFSSESKTGSSSSSSIPSIVFGCSNDSSGSSFNEKTDGLIGLGGGNASLVSQLDSTIHGKFSYCLVPYSDENATSTLRLGDSAVVSGPGLVSIPMVVRSYTFYIISLLSLSVGKNTPIPYNTTTLYSNHIIVDSGTTVTYIPQSTLNGLIDNLSKMINLTRVKDPQKYFRLCYSHPEKAPAYPFPDITFNFDNPPHGQVPLVLTPMQAFIHVSDDVVCLAMHEAEQVRMAIFGNIAQQNMHVGYDLQTNVISFAPANCSNI